MKKYILVLVLLFAIQPSFAANCADPNAPVVDCGDGTFLCSEKASQILRDVNDLFFAMDGLFAVTVGLSNQKHPGCFITASFEMESNLENVKKVFPKGIVYKGFTVEFETGSIPYPIP